MLALNSYLDFHDFYFLIYNKWNYRDNLKGYCEGWIRCVQ